MCRNESDPVAGAELEATVGDIYRIISLHGADKVIGSESFSHFDHAHSVKLCALWKDDFDHLDVSSRKALNLNRRRQLKDVGDLLGDQQLGVE